MEIEASMYDLIQDKLNRIYDRQDEEHEEQRSILARIIRRCNRHLKALESEGLSSNAGGDLQVEVERLIESLDYERGLQEQQRLLTDTLSGE